MYLYAKENTLSNLIVGGLIKQRELVFYYKFIDLGY